MSRVVSKIGVGDRVVWSFTSEDEKSTFIFSGTVLINYGTTARMIEVRMHSCESSTGVDMNVLTISASNHKAYFDMPVDVLRKWEDLEYQK